MKERAERQKIEAKVKFIVDADVIPAESVDISESGISFKTDTPIKVTMRMGSKYAGDIEDKTAELVWTKKESDGSTTYGLEFVEEPENPPAKEPDEEKGDPNIW